MTSAAVGKPSRDIFSFAADLIKRFFSVKGPMVKGVKGVMGVGVVIGGFLFKQAKTYKRLNKTPLFKILIKNK